MSTIASPRPSTSLSSRRTSADSSTTTAATVTARRNRAALRDYYNLKASAPSDVSNGAQVDDGTETESELDREGFDAQAYVKNVLQKEGLEGCLRVEGALVGEIRGLDGERKALVYDNYSKLIAATDTIRKMRTNMDPLTPTTSTLSAAIAHIAETAAALSHHHAVPDAENAHSGTNNSHPNTKGKEVHIVRWVLNTPSRLHALLTQGHRGAADAEWADVRVLLEKWRGREVAGVEELWQECESAFKTSGSEAS
ncbi:hypothetical protein LTR16_005971 [Cryomyces antarcticus]|uniref:Vacuolar protein sorting-associated protein 51 homolog n=1 Tax=Cryomyces antarcticus TaxID=329879 RepID=A0ABR0LM30_9PEZI|nr:hypothetical protein LTR16_005971 [Cryomyces antarcticus]